MNDVHWATGSGDQTVVLWDVITMSKVTTFLGHTAAVMAIDTFNDNENIIVSASVDANCKIFDKREGAKSIATLLGHSRDVNCISTCSNGNSIVSGGDDT